MNRTSLFLFMGVMTAVAPSAFAASTTDVTVTGTITPAACTPSLGGGGTFEFGTIAAQDLNENSETRFISTAQPLSVACNGPTRFALRGIDGRLEGVISDTPNVFGLGLNGTEKVGQYTLRTPVSSYMADSSTTVRSLWSFDNGVSWQGGDFNNGPEIGLAGNILSQGVLSGYTQTGGTEPVAISSFSTQLIVDLYIAPSKDLTVNNDIAIDGAATIEVVYL